MKSVILKHERARLAYIEKGLRKYRRRKTDISSWESPFLLDIIKRLEKAIKGAK